MGNKKYYCSHLVFTNSGDFDQIEFKCLGDPPSILQVRSIGERIIAQMKGFVAVSEMGMVG